MSLIFIVFRIILSIILILVTNIICTNPQFTLQGSCVSEAGSLTPDRCCSLFIGCLSGSASCTNGDLDIQDTARIVSTIPGRSATTSTTDKIAAVLRRSTGYHEHKLHWRHALSLWLRPLSGTVCRPTSGRATVRLAVDFQTPSENSPFYRRVCVT